METRVFCSAIGRGGGRAWRLGPVIVKQDPPSRRLKVVELPAVGHSKEEPDHDPEDEEADGDQEGERFQGEVSSLAALSITTREEVAIPAAAQIGEISPAAARGMAVRL